MGQSLSCVTPCITGNADANDRAAFAKRWSAWSGVWAGAINNAVVLGMFMAMVFYINDLMIALNRSADDITIMIGTMLTLFHVAGPVLKIVYSIPITIVGKTPKDVSCTDCMYICKPKWLGGYAENLFHPGANLVFGGLGALFMGMTLYKPEDYAYFFGFGATGAFCWGVVYWNVFGGVFTIRHNLNSKMSSTFALILQFFVLTVWLSIRPSLLEVVESNFLEVGKLWKTQLPYDLFILCVIWFVSNFIMTASTISDNAIKRGDDNAPATSSTAKDSMSNDVYHRNTLWYNGFMFISVVCFQISVYIFFIWKRPISLDPFTYTTNETLHEGTFTGANLDHLNFWQGWGAMIGVAIVGATLLMYTKWMSTDDEYGRLNMANNLLLWFALIGVTILPAVWSTGFMKSYMQYSLSAAFYGGFFATADMLYCFVICEFQGRSKQATIQKQNMRDFNAIVILATAKALGLGLGVIITEFGLNLMDLRVAMIVSSVLGGAAILFLMISWMWRYHYGMDLAVDVGPFFARVAPGYAQRVEAMRKDRTGNRYSAVEQKA